MVDDAEKSNRMVGMYPLLEAVLSAKGLPMKGVWKIADVAKILDVRSRTIFDWVGSGKLVVRDLPGHGRFLSSDIEEFLRNSRRPQMRRSASRGEQQ
jgi:hypothetical protein